MANRQDIIDFVTSFYGDLPQVDGVEDPKREFSKGLLFEQIAKVFGAQRAETREEVTQSVENNDIIMMTMDELKDGVVTPHVFSIDGAPENTYYMMDEDGKNIASFHSYVPTGERDYKDYDKFDAFAQEILSALPAPRGNKQKEKLELITRCLMATHTVGEPYTNFKTALLKVAKETKDSMVALMEKVDTNEVLERALQEFGWADLSKVMADPKAALREAQGKFVVNDENLFKTFDVQREVRDYTTLSTVVNFLRDNFPGLSARYGDFTKPVENSGKEPSRITAMTGFMPLKDFLENGVERMGLSSGFLGAMEQKEEALKALEELHPIFEAFEKGHKMSLAKRSRAERVVAP